MKNSQPLEQEIWSKVSYLPPNIEVSTKGNIRQFITVAESVPMKTRLDGGYLVFSAMGKTYRVNRVVADVFIEKPQVDPDLKLVAIHKNGNKTDNRAENLEWVPAIDNMRRKYPTTTAIKNWIYCKELDKAFSTLFTASFLTGLPERVITQSIKENAPFRGLSFEFIDKGSKKDAYYIHPDDAFELARKATSKEELTKLINEYLED